MEKSTTDNLNGSGRRKKGTFIVKVDHYEKGTWQGEVVWAEEEKSQRFRSMLELIKLMDDALSEGKEISFEKKA